MRALLGAVGLSVLDAQPDADQDDDRPDGEERVEHENPLQVGQVAEVGHVFSFAF